MSTPEDLVEVEDESVSEDYLIKIRKFSDNRPELILFILEELMSHLNLSKEEKGKVIRDGIERWMEAGRA